MSPTPGWRTSLIQGFSASSLLTSGIRSLLVVGSLSCSLGMCSCIPRSPRDAGNTSLPVVTAKNNQKCFQTWPDTDVVKTLLYFSKHNSYMVHGHVVFISSRSHSLVAQTFSKNIYFLPLSRHQAPVFLISFWKTSGYLCNHRTLLLLMVSESVAS